MNRREFLATSAGAFLLPSFASAASAPANAAATTALLKGKAEHVISIWLGGGMGQIDTFDPKRRGDPKKKIPGAYYDAIPTAVSGVSVCEHLALTAPLMDRVACTPAGSSAAPPSIRRSVPSSPTSAAPSPKACRPMC
jgi:hypothetical protein